MPNQDPNIKEIKVAHVGKAAQMKNNKPKDKKNILIKICAGIGALSILGGGLMIYNASSIKKQDTAQYQKNKSKISNLNDELDQLEKEKPAMTVASGQEALATAIDSGNKLADLQNQYVSVGNDASKIQDVVKQEMPLLRSKDDKSTAWFDTGDKNTQGKWVFASKYQFSQDTIKAIFLNRNSKNQLLAYATADYYPDKKQFSNIKVVQTDAGKMAVAHTDTRNEADKKKNEFNKTVDRVQDATKNDKPVKFNEEQRKEMADREWRDFQTMKKQRGEN